MIWWYLHTLDNSFYMEGMIVIRDAVTSIPLSVTKIISKKYFLLDYQLKVELHQHYLEQL